MEIQHQHTPSWQIGGLVICVTAFTFFLSNRLDLRKRNPRNLPSPPGPAKLPFLGNMLDLSKPGLPWEVYTNWGRVHGDMVSLTAPGASILVLNSVAVINDLVERRSYKYSDRVQAPAILMAKGDWNMGVLPYGSWWRAHRRAFHQLMNEKAIPQYRPIVEKHTLKYLRRLFKDPKNFYDHTQALFGEAIMHIAYGTEDEEYVAKLTILAEKQIQGLSSALVPGRYLVNTLPFLRFVPSWCPGTAWKQHFKYLADVGWEMTNKPFEDAKQRIRDGTQGEHPSLAAQLLHRLPPSDDPHFRNRELISKNVAAVAYIGGADTTIGTTCGLILALAMHPDAQRRAQEEIDMVVGIGRLPEFDDYERLPYLQAVVKEVVRLWPVAPIGIPHVTSEDDTYNDYFIAHGTVVFTNTWAVFRDPKHYPNPFEFRPERFLKDGQINPDVLDPESCVFGYGRRICPGRHLSRDSLSLVAASLVALFNVESAKDESGNPIPLRYTPNGSMIVKPERFECHITPRSPQHAALINEG